MTKIDVPDYVISGPIAPRADPMLREGTLFAVDYRRMPGVPTGTTSVPLPNLAWQTAAAMIGSGTESSLAGDFVNVGASTAGITFERTLKGGLHAMVSLSSDVSGKYWATQWPTSIADYVNANDSHNTYACLFAAVTRIGAGAVLNPMVRVGPSGSVYKNAIFERPASGYAAGEPTTSIMLGRTTVLTPSRPAVFAHASSAFTMSSVPNSVTYMGPLAAGNLHTSPSFVVYKFVFEDLTVSGLTWDEAHAIDVEEFNRMGLYADTWNIPA